MTDIIAALDTISNKKDDELLKSQLGENMHLEYCWSDDVYMREKLLQLFFQIVRCDINKRCDLFNKFQTLIQSAYIEYYKNNENTKQVAKEILVNAFKMIAYTRDIINGKGEYRLAYSLLRAWYEAGFSAQNYTENFFTTTAKQLLKLFLLGNDEQPHQYGSWKDVKYLAQDKYALLAKNEKVRLQGFEYYATDGLVNEAVELMISQLKEDINIYSKVSNENKPSISLAARWVPREKSKKFGDLNKFIAHKFYNNYIKTANNSLSLTRARVKAQTEFRKNVATLNKYLNTVQIKQCKNTWSDINFEKDVTSITMSKQRKAFLNSKKKDSLDREQCAKNFADFLVEAQKGNTIVKGKRVFVGDFVKEARSLLFNRRYKTLEEREQLNNEILALDLAWKDNSSQNKQLRNFIAMVDTSGSMEGDNCFPLNSAIGLGIRIAEMSSIGNRVLTFSNEPDWVNLENQESFVKKVEIMSHSNWSMNTNFYAALKMILEAAVKANMSASEVNDLTLVVLSDMQMDQADNTFLTVEKDNKVHSISRAKQLDKNIDELFYQTGMSVSGEPWKAPHILFWNLRSTNGFPSVSNKQNTTMISGANSALLNAFCEKGVETMNEVNPYKFMVELFDNKRYSQVEQLLNNLI